METQQTDQTLVPKFVLVGTSDSITPNLMKVHVRYVRPPGYEKIAVLLRGRIRDDVEFTFWSREGDRVQNVSPAASIVEAIKREFVKSVFYGHRQFGVTFLI